MPDAYEEDNTCGHAKVIGTDGVAQTHTFHMAGDTDWVKFLAVTDRTYIIETANVGPQSDAVLALFDACNDGPLGNDDNAFGQTVRLEWNAVSGVTYYLKLQNHNPNSYGADTYYDLIVSGDVVPPPIPRNPRCASLNQTTLSMQWQRSAGSDVVGYVVRYRAADLSQQGAPSVSGADTSYYELDHLKPNMIYYMSVKGIDYSNNASAESEEVFCRTSNPDPETAPTLTMQQPTAGTTYSTTRTTINFTGIAQDADGNLSRVQIRNKTTGSEGWDYSLSGGSDDFSVSDIPLESGNNDIEATVYDQKGNRNSVSLNVHRVTQNSTNKGAVILVAGRREDDDLQVNIDQTVNRAYRTFRDAGFLEEDIYYLAPASQDPDGDGTSEVNAPANLANLKTAIETWAAAKVGPGKPLYIYMMDHGNIERFCIDGCLSNEATSKVLDESLETLETNTGADQITVIIEACHSGSFIDRQAGSGYDDGLSYSISKAGRVVISSTDRQHNAYASVQGALFSDSFFSCIADSGDLKECFLAAKAAVTMASDLQMPWLDDNGNGQSDVNDGTVAQARHVAQSFGATLPQITNPKVTVASTNGTLTARVVAGSTAIDLVWAAVYAPSFQEPTTTTLELGVPVLRLSPDPATPGAFRATYPNGFTEAGSYRVIFYARDRMGLLAQPALVIPGARSLFLPLILRQ